MLVYDMSKRDLQQRTKLVCYQQHFDDDHITLHISSVKNESIHYFNINTFRIHRIIDGK